MAEINKPEGLNVMWAELGEKREPSDAKKRQGWVAEIPTYQDFNWLDGRQDQFIAHVNQHGLVSWDAETEYQAGKSYVMGTNGVIYKALTTNTGNNPIGDTINWDVAFWGAGNTTVDTNGFIKEASPIVKLFSNSVMPNRYTTDVVFQKESLGVYRLFTKRTLFRNGWNIEIPKDVNGNTLVFLEYEETDYGMEIRTFKPSYKNGKVVAGAVTDIPEQRWVDIRMSYLDSEIEDEI